MITNPPNNGRIHPSFLALDRVFLGDALPEVSTHLSDCEECRSYLESLPQLSLASDFGSVQRLIAAKPRFSLAWILTPVALVAAACAVLLFTFHPPARLSGGEEAYVGAKGFRSVWIYVKRGTDTQLWDGKRSLVAGDRVRLKIDPGGYHHIQVYSLSEPRNPILLYEGPLVPGQNLMLPEAWEIDDSPAAEQLIVVFSNASVQPAWQEWREGRAGPGVALLSFTLPKVGRATTDAGQFSP
ncbi:MAG: hypothetical protein ABW061_29160 [Polyangiaceae bacterium]